MTLREIWLTATPAEVWACVGIVFIGAAIGMVVWWMCRGMEK